MATPPYHFGRREENDYHRRPDCKLFKLFDVQCLCGSHNIKIVAESDDEGFKVNLFCLACRKREEMNLR